MITRNVAKYGCIIFLIIFSTTLFIAIKESIGWLIITSIVAIVIYSIGIGIVIYSYKKDG